MGGRLAALRLSKVKRLDGKRERKAKWFRDGKFEVEKPKQVPCGNDNKKNNNKAEPAHLPQAVFVLPV
jgi:hypothetical protein